MGLFDIFLPEKKRLQEVRKMAQEIDRLKEQYRALSDQELQAKTVEFRTALEQGTSLEAILIPAFATAREASYRVRGEFPFLVQLMGSIILCGGDIVEMKTGEGKTLTSVMAAYLNALPGKGIHIVTANEYLAKRDAETMGEVHRFLGLTVGCNFRELSREQKKRAFACDITYTTNSELGFDYLRDNMVTDKEHRVLRGLNYAIIDEVDSILIDESRTPLIISGGRKKTANLYFRADMMAKSLEPEDYQIDIKSKQIFLTSSGIEKAENFFGVDNLYELEHSQIVHHLNQALKANYVMERDVEYMVYEDEILIIDSFTGRSMPGRAFSDGLHQAIEAKEGVTIKEETSTMATITYQNFFRLYDKLSGMTGTAKTEEEEFLSIYNMHVYEIETNVPIQRQDHPDIIYPSKEAKYKAIIEEVKELNQIGRPVLVGTASVEVSEYLSRLMRKSGVEHQVLNAKNHEREAEIIANAGQVGAVTIATNMAGRGTDIKLSPEAKALGGLVVLGSERHESRRIDNQLRGRSGRQGDPGYSRFYVSLEDELWKRFGAERVRGLMQMTGDEPIVSRYLTKQITEAQKRVEGFHFDTRKSLIDYDDVLRRQRELIYCLRNYILDNEDAHALLKEILTKTVTKLVNRYQPKKRKLTLNDITAILEQLSVGKDLVLPETLTTYDKHTFIDKLVEIMWADYNQRIEKVKESFYRYEKNIVLHYFDENWVDHIDTMTKLREGIHLRSYAQHNPLQMYIEEGYQLFEEMVNRTNLEVVNFIMDFEIQLEHPEMVEA